MLSTLVSHKSVGWLKGKMDQRKGEINKERQEEERKNKSFLYVTPAVLFSRYDEFLLLVYIVLYAKGSRFLCYSVHVTVLSDHYTMPRYGKEVN
jgi:hypothetical protein